MSVIDEYLQNVENLQKIELEKIRRLTKQVAPDAKEVISYGLPGFKYKNKYLITFASFKNHMSIFPGAEAIEHYSEQLKGFKTSKGTIRFTVQKPIPENILVGIIKYRMSDIDSKIE